MKSAGVGVGFGGRGWALGSRTGCCGGSTWVLQVVFTWLLFTVGLCLGCSLGPPRNQRHPFSCIHSFSIPSVHCKQGNVLDSMDSKGLKRGAYQEAKAIFKESKKTSRRSSG